MSGSNSTIKDYGSTNFITGMRAWAAFAVFLIHSGGGGLRELGNIPNDIVDLGKTGVYAFFVISGFTVAESFKHSASYSQYLFKRILKIAPLYYILISLQFGLQNFTNFKIDVKWDKLFLIQYDWTNLLYHFTFLSFLNYKITNSVLGIEWSIPIEIFWYILIPLFLMTQDKRLGLILFFLFSLLLSIISKYIFNSNLASDVVGLAYHWSPYRYGLCFMLGTLAHYWRPFLAQKAELKRWHMQLLLLLFSIFLYKPFLPEIQFVSLFTFIVLLFGGQNWWHRWLLEDKRVMYLGTISFSFYLWHFLVIMGFKQYFQEMGSVLLFFSTFSVSLIISAISYHFIERPIERCFKEFLKKKYEPEIQVKAR